MPGKGRSKCKGPGLRGSAPLRRQNKASVAGTETMDGMRGGGSVEAKSCHTCYSKTSGIPWKDAS